MAKPSALKGSEFDYIFSHNVDILERHILTDYYLWNGEPANPSDHFPILAVCSLRDPRGQRVWHVSSDGDDKADGSASAPFASLSAALAAAYSGDEIRLTAGTYRQSAVVDKSVTIAGGYDTAFDKVVGISMIDGDLNGDDDTGSYADNLSTLIDVPRYYNLTLRDLELRNNVSTSSTDEGALHFAGNSLKMENVTFSGNHAMQNGAAVWADCNELIASGCRFTGNTAPANGGAIWSNVWGDSRFTECTFDSNEAAAGAAIYTTSDDPDPSHIEFTWACNIFDGCAVINSRSTRKGAITLDGKMPNIRTVLINSTLAGNIMESPSGMAALTKKYGGSVINATLSDKGKHDCHNSTVEMAHCTVAGNTATFKGSNKANYGGGAILTSGGTTHLVNNLFMHNVTDAASGNSDLVAETGATSNRNIFSHTGSTSCAIGTGSLCASPNEAKAMVDIKDGHVTLSEKPGCTPAVLPLSTRLGTTPVNTISGANTDIERIFGIDLDNDGMSSRTLPVDQWNNARQSSTMPGAMEYVENSAVDEVPDENVRLTVTHIGDGRYRLNGIDGKYDVYSLSGVSVLRGCGINTATVDLSACPTGVYIVCSGSRTGKFMIHR